MVAAIPKPIRALTQYEFELGYSIDMIAAGPYNVGLRTIQRMRRMWRLYGTVFIPYESVERRLG